MPAKWQQTFAREAHLLNTHRGWDPGALEFARFLAKHTKAPLHATQWTRLLCDCNRDADNAKVWSSIGSKLDASAKQQILEAFHQPYRQAVQQELASMLARGESVFHLSLHSFTPKRNGVVRPCELGIMYDSRIAEEKQLAKALQQHLSMVDAHFRVRLNYPYVGRSTYFQPALRKQFAAPQYLALQIEVNQKIPRQQKARWQRLQRALLEFLRG
jgi:predicted N-formylglutamate amidohydrolase